MSEEILTEEQREKNTQAAYNDNEREAIRQAYRIQQLFGEDKWFAEGWLDTKRPKENNAKILDMLNNWGFLETAVNKKIRYHKICMDDEKRIHMLTSEQTRMLNEISGITRMVRSINKRKLEVIQKYRAANPTDIFYWRKLGDKRFCSLCYGEIKEVAVVVPDEDQSRQYVFDTQCYKQITGVEVYHDNLQAAKDSEGKKNIQIKE